MKESTRARLGERMLAARVLARSWLGPALATHTKPSGLEGRVNSLDAGVFWSVFWELATARLLPGDVTMEPRVGERIPDLAVEHPNGTTFCEVVTLVAARGHTSDVDRLRVRLAEKVRLYRELAHQAPVAIVVGLGETHMGHGVVTEALAAERSRPLDRGFTRRRNFQRIAAFVSIDLVDVSPACATVDVMHHTREVPLARSLLPLAGRHQIGVADPRTRSEPCGTRLN